MDDEQPKPKNTWGGKRPGAGQPRTREAIPNANDIKRQFFSGDKLHRLLHTLLDIALNEPVLTTVIDKDGKPHRIRQRPYGGREQVAALSDLLDRGLGKPVQGVDLQGDLMIGSSLPEVRYFLNGVELLQQPNSNDIIDGQFALADHATDGDEPDELSDD